MANKNCIRRPSPRAKPDTSTMFIMTQLFNDSTTQHFNSCSVYTHYSVPRVENPFFIGTHDLVLICQFTIHIYRVDEKFICRKLESLSHGRYVFIFLFVIPTTAANATIQENIVEKRL